MSYPQNSFDLGDLLDQVGRVVADIREMAGVHDGEVRKALCLLADRLEMVCDDDGTDVFNAISEEASGDE
jgi:hypothetical protein